MGSEPDGVEKTAEVPKEVAKELAAPESKKEEKPELLKKSFEKLAQESAALRKEKDELKAERAIVDKYKMVDKMVESKDAMGLLATFGIKYSTWVKQVMEKGEGAPDAEETPKGTKVDPMATRIEALEKIINEERYNRSVDQLLGKIEEVAKAQADKFPLVNSDKATVKQVHSYLLDFVQRTGKPPGDTIEESVQMALEAVEADQGKEAEKWRKRLGLTDKKVASSVEEVTKSASDPAASELANKSKTLTNSHASAPRTVGSNNQSETPEELRRKATELLNKLG